MIYMVDGLEHRYMINATDNLRLTIRFNQETFMNIFEDIREVIVNVAISIGVEDINLLNKITAEPPKDESYGDISTNIALLSSKFLKKNPKEIAIDVVVLIKKNKFINEAKIAGPGFINFHTLIIEENFLKYFS